jgi:RNA polymerase sigma-70 factor (ECF subfamily)
MNETQLVQAAQSGDFEAFSTLIGQHKDRIYGLARKLSGNAEDADDIVQETFLKAIDNIDKFRLEASFGTWLHSIALNEARALFAKRKQTDLRPLEEYLPAGHGISDARSESPRLFDWHDPHKALEDDELRRITDEAIQSLPYIYREAFLLRYIEEMSVKEIAEQIGESEAAAKSRILRARLALRDFLSKRFEDSYGQKMPGIHRRS